MEHNFLMLELEFGNQTSDSRWSADFFRKIVETALKRLDSADKQVELGIQLVGPERSQELNRQYRHKDKPTDVLSFPLNEQPADNALNQYGILPLGDIVICLEVAEKQATESAIPLKEELARLVVHGLLHLFGYDHERSEADEETMSGLEEEILKLLD
ncbi:MAG TPA: rRNA maturation RNase YbeY [Candidatus Paceibacterota bacterium]|nr:rRNA maturation RNase YbeY [Candidatus Paceibacterota bacterium]